MANIDELRHAIRAAASAHETMHLAFAEFPAHTNKHLELAHEQLLHSIEILAEIYVTETLGGAAEMLARLQAPLLDDEAGEEA